MEVAGAREINRSIRGSLGAAAVILAMDVGLLGSILYSPILCPIWIFVSLLKSAIHRPGWNLTLVRLLIPALTLGVAWANDAFQRGMAETNAQRLIAACEKYHTAHGSYPEKLDELVPQYMSSVPVAKYCMGWNRFLYHRPLLWWHVVPPYFRKTYNCETRRWSYLD